MEDFLKRKETETLKQYKRRLCENKKAYNINWNQIGQLMSVETGGNSHPDKYRKWWESYSEGLRDAISDNLKKDDSKNGEITVLKHEYDNYQQVKSYKEITEINKDGSYSSDKLIGIEDESKLKDESFLLDVHGYDNRNWQIVSARNSIWNTQLKGGKVTKLYASKINVKPRTDSISVDEMKEWLKDFDREYNTVKNYTYGTIENGLLLEIPLVDVHFNKRSYEIEIGIENTIAKTEECFLRVISDFIHRVEGKKIEKIIFPIGNDFYNADTTENTTTRGTRQDVELRWKEMFKRGNELLIKAIDMLSEVAPVEVFYVEGNHDTISSYHTIEVLAAWYRKDENVTINTCLKRRKYVEFGNCLIGFSHGDKEKNRIFGTMQSEVPELWGRTKFREWHLGHLHHEVVKENQGVIVRHISSISPLDAWHYESGYVGSLQKAQAFLWDKERGLLDILNSN